MQVEIVEGAPETVEADVLAFPVHDPVELSGAAGALDARLGGRLGQLVDEGELKGELGCVTLLHTPGELPAGRVAAVGIGELDDVDADALRTAAARVAVRAGKIGAETLAWVLDEDGLPVSAAEQARAAVDGVAFGPHGAGRWKTSDEGPQEIERLVLCGATAESVRAEAGRAAVAADWTNRCRDLVNAPANELTPAALADFARDLAAGSTHLEAEVLGPEEIRGAGMGAFEAVSRGSHNEPRLIVLRYEPPERARPEFLLGLVGKAITFDAGGLSLKTASGMVDMKTDMGGGAAVLAGLGAIAELGLPVRTLAVVPACENMPSGHAFRPGDIVTAMNGKTIETTNTDAEGRLVLADALWHARQLGATHLVDLATLTGAIVTAMGDFYAGLFGNDPGWTEEVRGAAEASGDHAWVWPIHETYRRYIESPFADMKNSSELKQAGPIYAARFLAEFVGEGPWVHLDIAGTAYLERSRGDYYDGPGATGYGVRLLAELARRLS
jgi:leucyl aminopeptidase